MENQNDIVNLYVSKQIALEEHLFKIIEDQISEINELEYNDAKVLLKKTSQILEYNFISLNEQLDKIERDTFCSRKKTVERNQKTLQKESPTEQENKRTSRILREVYSTLNLITISNTQLHTTALALDSVDVANLALKNLKTLAPLVVLIGELIPDIVTRELYSVIPTIDLSVAQRALVNTKLAWKRSA
jgi:hypothetical protein